MTRLCEGVRLWLIEVVEECISASVGVILFPVAEAREEWEEVREVTLLKVDP